MLRVALELHPKSPILYDSLGEFYAQTGQKELAIQAYQKALEANPAFKQTKEALRSIFNDQFSSCPAS
jgi:tetratricopeptide (TPR) repeat protein